MYNFKFFSLSLAEIATVICAANKVSTVLDQVSACPTLHHVISMGESLEDEEVQKAESAGLKLHTMSQIEVCVCVYTNVPGCVCLC